MAEQAKTAKKTTAKRKPATRKPAKRKPVAKKTTARKPAAKKTAKKTTAKSAPDFSSRAQEMGRNAFLASLGFYGKAFDQAQDQFDSLQDQLEARRKKADKTYKELVKRGKKVEKNAKNALEDIDLPKIEIESLTDRKQLEAQLKKAKARFEDLRETVGLKAA
ncbi:MAG: hypothetical protein AB8C02_11190 [Halioglobus sp.]